MAVDSTAVKIGEQIDYILQVKADSTAQVVFPEQPLFAPFELLEASPVDIRHLLAKNSCRVRHIGYGIALAFNEGLYRPVDVTHR